MNWRIVGIPCGPRSHAVLVVLVMAGLGWLSWPIWDSLSAPSRSQAVAEAPWLLGALVVGLAALAVGIWLDAGCRLDALSTLAALVVANTVLRAVLNPGAAGVEFVHAIPLVAGIVAGGPAGFFVGAASALVSTIVVGSPAATLPAQALVWGISGMLGGLLWRLRPRVAWLISLPLAVGTGALSGVLLNLMGWGQEIGMNRSGFTPGLPPSEVIARLWRYTLDTSILFDLTRGLTSAALLAVFGYRWIVALRHDLGVTVAHRGLPYDAIDPHAIARREDRTRFDQLWNQGASS
jgi:energy-coupling factor transport system substrate-specific component